MPKKIESWRLTRFGEYMERERIRGKDLAVLLNRNEVQISQWKKKDAGARVPVFVAMYLADMWCINPREILEEEQWPLIPDPREHAESLKFVTSSRRMAMETLVEVSSTAVQMATQMLSECLELTSRSSELSASTCTELSIKLSATQDLMRLLSLSIDGTSGNGLRSLISRISSSSGERREGDEEERR